jgi:spore coat polysaccharide biosynthesis predicted glycosyltransferase SpsG
MKIAFRADAGLEQGSGHVVRTLTLAKEFKQSGHDVQIFTAIRAIPWLTEFVESSGVKVQNTKADSLDLPALLGQNFDFLVVDSYEIPAHMISAAAREIETLAIVDHQTRGISADYLLDHNLAASEFLTETKSQQLIGPKFALVRKEIRELRRVSSSRLSKAGKPNVLVMFGGTDPLNLSVIVSEIMEGLDTDFEINFIAPKSSLDSIGRHFPGNRAKIHKLTPQIQHLLAKADLVFSAAGTSVLDISCIGIPSIYTSVAENQNPAIDAISQLRLGLTIESMKNRRLVKKDVLEAIYACAFDDQVREELFTNSQNLVDGYGARRVVDSITDQNS